MATLTIQDQIKKQYPAQPTRQRPSASLPASASAQPRQACDYCGAVGRPGYVGYNVPVGHELFGHVIPCPKCNAQGVNDLCGLHEHERTITLSDIELDQDRPGAKAMHHAAAEFVRSPYDFLSIHGSCGNGKTIALMAIVNACVSKGIDARYITGHILMDYLYEAFDPKIPETDTGRIRRLAQVPVLVIDEFTDARETPYAADMQKYLIDERYRLRHRLGTVLAWNGDLSAIPWAKVQSRLEEGVVIANNDDDMRPMIGRAKARARGW